MSKQKDVPGSAITLRTYAELEEMARKFAGGHFNLLGVVGTGGLAKTETFKRVMKELPHLLLKGHTTAFMSYQSLYYHVDEPVVIDDADTLFADKKCAPLLKCLCETTERKRVAWNSKAIDDADLPRSFETTSRTAILANEWRTITGNMKAVADRGIFIHFLPSVREVHLEVGRGGWLKDDDVYGHVERHLHLVSEPSMRYYVKARELKRADIKDWRDKTLNMLNPNLDNKALEVASKLMADDAIKTKEERAKRFIKLTGLSRATYFRYAKLLREAQGD